MRNPWQNQNATLHIRQILTTIDYNGFRKLHTSAGEAHWPGRLRSSNASIPEFPDRTDFPYETQCLDKRTVLGWHRLYDHSVMLSTITVRTPRYERQKAGLLEYSTLPGITVRGASIGRR